MRSWTRYPRTTKLSGSTLVIRVVQLGLGGGASQIAEVVRVLKPGGKFIIVESSQPSNPVIKPLFHVFLKGFVAPVGSLISRNKEAYQYLATSVSNYFTPAEVKQMLVKAGFSGVTYRPLVFGSAGIHVAVK